LLLSYDGKVTDWGLIIGGSSCVGKTTVARHLCARLNLTLVETDRSLPDDPRLQPLDGSLEIWDRPTAELRDLLIVAAETAVPYLLQQISSLAASGTGWIVEGERVHPNLIERLQRDGRAQGVFIIETDAARLYRTLMERLPGFKKIAESRRRTVAEVDRLYNLWLAQEASERNLPCLESQPWQTLPERVLAVASQATACQGNF
jgi:2-phosphoglycerate kinase